MNIVKLKYIMLIDVYKRQPLDVAIHPTLVAFSAFIVMSLKLTFFISAVELEI